jgi:hypothetical protein
MQSGFVYCYEHLIFFNFFSVSKAFFSPSADWPLSTEYCLLFRALNIQTKKLCLKITGILFLIKSPSIYLLLEFDRDRISLLEENGISPEVVSQRSELMELPLPESPRCQLVLSVTPVAGYIKQRVD